MLDYQAYLLRVWRETEADSLRATLENPHTGERLGFASAEALLAYLSASIVPGAPASAGLPPAPVATHPSAAASDPHQTL
jgi:hypothetical protein